MVKKNEQFEKLKQFKLTDKPVSCERYGNGHINTTYLVKDTFDRQYILQKINTHIFRDPVSLMNNIQQILRHLRLTSVSSRDIMTLIPTMDGNTYLVDENNHYWRMFDFISDSICINETPTPHAFYESGVAFGQFQRRLADFDASLLTETIPDFHHTPKRYQAFREAVAADAFQRLQTAEKEIAFAFEHETYASTLTTLQDAGELTLRVTHNDTKLNNVLFDRLTHKAICVIDLDTVMPGLTVNDFGDSIRFGASTGAEDEVDLDKIHFSLPMFKAYTEGFLFACKNSLTDSEIEHLRDGAKMMTLECGVRFLTDYLSGDQYYQIRRSNHNLDRCRTQFKLVAEMERNWGKMWEIVAECAGKKTVWTYTSKR